MNKYSVKVSKLYLSCPSFEYLKKNSFQSLRNLIEMLGNSSLTLFSSGFL